MFDVVEGDDYIVDRYKVIGLDRYASIEAVKDAIKRMKAENHPDRLHNVSDAVRKTAETQWRYAEFAEAILADEAKKLAYDTRLKWFEENEPKSISDSPDREIVNYGRSSRGIKIDLNSLLEDEAPDQTKIHVHLDGLAGGVSERTLKRLKKAWQDDPSDLETKAEYREALERRWALVANKEDLAWQRAGVFGRIEHAPAIIDPAFYMEDVSDQLKKVQEEDISAAVDSRVAALLSYTGKPLFLTDETGAKQQLATKEDLGEEQQRKILEKVRGNFQRRQHTIELIAKEKQTILEELLELADKHIVSEGQETGKTIVHSMVAKKGETPIVAMTMQFDNATGHGEIVEGDQGKTLAQLKAEKSPHNSYAIEVSHELMNQETFFAHFTSCYQAFKGDKGKGQQVG